MPRTYRGKRTQMRIMAAARPRAAKLLMIRLRRRGLNTAEALSRYRAISRCGLGPGWKVRGRFDERLPCRSCPVAPIRPSPRDPSWPGSVGASWLNGRLPAAFSGASGNRAPSRPLSPSGNAPGGRPKPRPPPSPIPRRTGRMETMTLPPAVSRISETSSVESAVGSAPTTSKTASAPSGKLSAACAGRTTSSSTLALFLTMICCCGRVPPPFLD